MIRRIAWALLATAFVGCGGAAAPTGGAAGPGQTKVESAPKPEPAVVPIEPRLTQAQGELEDASTAFGAAGSDCASLCKALSSMTRATDHLCELAKEASEPKRCDDAKARLDDANKKVKSTCGGCG